ncbi:ApaG domain-containing protein [Candidatus Methylacidithermus pantelleriae]|uniref:ApaG domain-containing protein n=1 Tax=Candidatus Methylacidithermus pantelleriae TaxID=2744239 RepID=UPI001BD38006|nr:ApaG domain [Candidatus Methylacidithermus pantelleriae]
MPGKEVRGRLTVVEKKDTLGAMIRGIELPGLRATLDHLDYSPFLWGGPHKRHAFVYYITIANDSPHTVTLQGRKWVLTSPLGKKTVIEGDGIVGERPRLRPGDRFHYHSYHLVGGRAWVEGSYFGIDESGRWIVVRIPGFALEPPLIEPSNAKEESAEAEG